MHAFYDLGAVFIVIYPVAEIFESIQGEGIWAGTPMAFIRLAGCCVGKPYTDTERKTQGLVVFQEKCTDWQGTEFPCDTDYRVWRRLTEQELVGWPDVKGAMRICITGGEPFIHDLEPLVRGLLKVGKLVHIETSGVRDIPAVCVSKEVWLTVSPKQGCLTHSIAHASEVRIIVGPFFDIRELLLAHDTWTTYFWKGRTRPSVFLSPVNGLSSLDAPNNQRCVELAITHQTRGFRVSVQLHKILGVR